MNWSDGQNIQSDNMTAGSWVLVNHAWEKPGSYSITITASDGSSSTVDTRIMEIYPLVVLKEIPTSSNFLLILLALLAFFFLLFFFLLGKRNRDEK